MNSEKDTDSEMERTKHDIHVRHSQSADQTRTQIKIDVEEEPTPGQKLPEKFGSIFKKFSFWLDGLHPFFKSQKMASPSLTRLKPYLSIWICLPNTSLIEKILFYAGRLLVLAVGFALVSLLVQSTHFSFEIQSEWKWVLLTVTCFSSLMMCAVFYLRLQAPWFMGFPLLFILVLLMAHVFYFPTNDPSFLTLFHQAPASFLNRFFAVLIFFEILFLFFYFPSWGVVRFLSIVLAVYGLSGLLVNEWQQIPFEASWVSPGLFSKFPLLWIQPVYVTLHIVLPFLCLVLLSLVFLKKESFFSLSWARLNLLFLFCLTILGFEIMFQNRVPSILSFLVPPPPMVGSLEAKMDDAELLLQTKNFESKRHSDNVARYQMQLSELPAEVVKKMGNQDSKKRSYELKVFKEGGLPDYFVNPQNFDLKVNGQKIRAWNLAWLDQKNRVGPSYLLSFKLPEKNIATSNDESAPTHEMDEAWSDRFALVLPQDGDSFVHELMIQAKIPSNMPQGIALDVQIDGKSVAKKSFPPFVINLNTDSYAEGPHVLTVSMVDHLPPSEEVNPVPQWEQKVNVIKKTGSFLPSLSFVRPTFGEYLLALTTVEISQNNQESWDRLELLLNDERLQEWKAPPYILEWNTMDLKEGEHVLKVRGFKSDGTQITRALSLFVGHGGIQVLPVQAGGVLPRGEGAEETAEALVKEDFLRYERVVFVLDASVSELDVWNGKSKWEWSKALFKDGVLSSHLQGRQVGILVGGGGDPFSRSNCEDVQWKQKMATFNEVDVEGALNRVHPKGVSTLVFSLKKALGAKPQKILVLTDGSDSCVKTIPSSLEKDLVGAKIPVDVIALGELSSHDTHLINSLVKKTGGNLVKVLEPEGLASRVAGLLSRNYELVLNEKVVFSSPIDGMMHGVQAGEYKLHIPVHPPFEDVPLSIRNHFVTKVQLGVKENSTVGETVFELLF